ncbi:hypothetical protein KFL_003540070 [Klebsormidium nitens]|uniref:Uncharacterized protein n=1 Tax=Klebsormidium nitens TaxID=105231 RepID=A0A1Y1I8Z8_KLENI|nr:hypothetical protein KFL_003540070 [Klebsormidium nitens]|eukprot:GAQ87454.1 hypothetical protein KFL_003540070 [Klebsormidium nitens]
MKDYDSGDERNGHEEDGPKKKKKKKKKEKGERHHREDRGRDDSDSDEPQDSWRGREPWGGHGAPPFWEGSESWGRGGHMFGPRGPPGEFGGARGGPRGDFAPGMFPPGEEAFRRGFMGPPEMGPNGMPLAPSEGGVSAAPPAREWHRLGGLDEG